MFKKKAFECSGRAEGLNLCIKGTSPGGKILTIGRAPTDTINVAIHLASDKEIDILGSFRYKNSYKKALELVECGKVFLINNIYK